MLRAAATPTPLLVTEQPDAGVEAVEPTHRVGIVGPIIDDDDLEVDVLLAGGHRRLPADEPRTFRVGMMTVTSGA